MPYVVVKKVRSSRKGKAGFRFEIRGSGMVLRKLRLLGGGEKFFEQCGPLIGKGGFVRGPAYAVVPVRSVAGIALFAMQVRVNHHAGTCFKLIDFRVGALPVAVRVPPERTQRGFKGGWRLVLLKGRPELGGVHEGSLVQLKCELDHMLGKILLVKRRTTKAIQNRVVGKPRTRSKVPLRTPILRAPTSILTGL
jgi:hypothetical protein